MSEEPDVLGSLAGRLHGASRQTNVSMRRSERVPGGLQVDVDYRRRDGETQAYRLHLPAETPRIKLDFDSGRLQVCTVEGRPVEELNIYSGQIGDGRYE